MVGAAPTYIRVCLLVATIFVVGAAATPSAGAESRTAAPLPADLWAVEVDSTMAQNMNVQFFRWLRAHGMNAVVLDRDRISPGQRAHIQRTAAAAELLVATAVRIKNLQGRRIQASISPNAAATRACRRAKLRTCTVLAPSVAAALRLSTSKAAQLVVVRLRSPKDVDKLKNLEARRWQTSARPHGASASPSRILAIVDLTFDPVFDSTSWISAIAQVQANGHLDLAVEPSLHHRSTALSLYLALLAKSGTEKGPGPGAEPTPSPPSDAPSASPSPGTQSPPTFEPPPPQAPAGPEPPAMSTDVTPPQAPGTPTQVAATQSSVTVYWSPSLDDVGVSGYGLYRDGTLIASGGGPSFTFTGLTCGTTYTFAVDASDAAGNRSPKFSVGGTTLACSAPTDESAPSAPAGVHTTSTSGTTLSLAWDASSDNVRVAGYGVYRDNVLVATSSDTSYTFSGLTCGTSYNVSVDAFDAAGNRSSRSSIIMPTQICLPTPPTSDTTAPSAPGSVRSQATATASIAVAWDSSTDNVGVSGYGLYRDNVLVGTTSDTSYTFSGLTCGTSYTLAVDAFDAAGNRSEKSSLGVSTEPCPPPPPSADTSAPSAPGSLHTTGTTTTTIAVAWSAATDNVAVTGYGVYRNGASQGTTGSTSYTYSGLTCGTSYALAVDAFDAAGNRSPQTPLVVATSACPDTTAPTNPSGLTVTSASTTIISLSWSPSTDNVAVTGYNLFLNGTEIGSTASTNHSFGGLSCGTSYTLGVQAYDAAGNRSAQNELVAATSPCLDMSAPTAPTGVTVTAASSTSISILWSPSFDNVGVSGYDVFLSGSKIASIPLTNYTFSGLTCGTSYTVGVGAYDAAGNVSTRSTVTAVTSSCTSPAPQTTAPPYRYMYNSGSDQAGVASYGWNLLDAGSKSAADALPAGTKGLVWVGDYNNANCAWQISDSTLRSEVSAMVGDPKVAGYFFSDEPDPYACPNASAEHKARSSLIHLLDPSKITVMVMDANSGAVTLNQIPLWVGAADYVGLDPYPCYQGKPCDYSWIDAVIKAADQAGLPYWGVVQAFNDSTWRWPTADEESHMLSQWAASKQSGYMTFAWTWSGNNLTSQPALLDVLRSFNNGSGSSSADTSPPTAPTGLTKVSSNATSISLSWSPSTDNVGVAGYGIYRNDTLVSSTSGTSYAVGGLTCGTSYTFSVDAYDAAGNRSAKTSLTVATSSSCTDTAAPSPPTNLNATGATGMSVSFSWAASTDNVGVAGYGVYRGGSLVASSTATNYTMGGLSCGTSYSIGVDAYDAAGNRSQQASLTIATSPCPDSTPPTAPGIPTVTGTTETSIALYWGPSIDNVGVAGYDVFLNGTRVGSATGTSYTYSSLSCGTKYTLGVEAYDAAGNHSTRASLGASTGACATPPSTTDPVIAAAGDICESATDCAPTATLLDQITPDRVLPLGDLAYPDGSPSDYTNYYDPNWGRQKQKTNPAPGNHDYHTSGAAGYFSYFGSQVPGPYYSYDLGSWHLISLNGEISISAGSAQETWLKNDLAAHPARCILAYWHEPRFSSGAEHGSNSSFDPFWQDLYAAGADIVLNGHDHDYERFAPQNPSGTSDPKGIREFVVGTGGASHYTFSTPIANSEVRDSTSFGVLKLTLHPASYDWQFLPIAGANFTDSGTTTCN